MAIGKQDSGELKTRVYSCLNKLSDRDTLSMAANELDSIARSLPNHAFATFLACLSGTNSSEKSPVRRHCVRLLSVLSAAHGDALSPHLSRMISAVVRRLRDPDSAVRASCVEAVASIAAHVNSQPFTVILKPLADAVFREQDWNAQIGASLCLSAAVEAAPEPDEAELRKLLPRVVKLVKCESFKAKPALISFIGGIISSGSVKSKNLLGSVVSTAVVFLRSEDWAARKAAAELLEKLAAADSSSTVEFKDICITALENRKFDKVKHVRETMNRALDIWKDLPSQPEVDLPSPEGSYRDLILETTQPKKIQFSASSPLSCSSTGSSQKSSITNEDNPRKQWLSSVILFEVNGNSNTDSNLENHQDVEDLSQVRKQLLQIETQQSNLLDLLQGFRGSSQKGMTALARRVDGLEKVLDGISRDLADSSRRISSVGDSRYKIHRADFS